MPTTPSPNPGPYTRQGTDYVPDGTGGDALPLIATVERRWLGAPWTPPVPQTDR